MRHFFAALLCLLLAGSCSADTVVIPRTIGGEAEWLNSQAGKPPFEGLERVRGVLKDNALSLEITGTPAALETVAQFIKVLEAMPPRQLEFAARMVRTRAPEEFLGATQQPLLIDLPGGKTVLVPPGAGIMPAASRPVWGDTIVVSSQPNAISVLRAQVADGRGAIINEPRVTNMEGVPATVEFLAPDTGKAVSMTIEGQTDPTGWVTVRAWLEDSNRPDPILIATQWRAPLGQTVALGVVRAGKTAPEKQVWLVTVTEPKAEGDE